MCTAQTSTVSGTAAAAIAACAHTSPAVLAATGSYILLSTEFTPYDFLHLAAFTSYAQSLCIHPIPHNLCCHLLLQGVQAKDT